MTIEQHILSHLGKHRDYSMRITEIAEALEQVRAANRAWPDIHHYIEEIPMSKQFASYTFTVTDLSQIDLDRIILENRARGIHATAVESTDGYLLLLSNEFLSRFDRGDAVVVRSERLRPSWGRSGIWVRFERDSPDFGTSPYNRDVLIALKTGMGRMTQDLFGLEREIRTALAYRRKIEVKVTPVGPAREPSLPADILEALENGPHTVQELRNALWYGPDYEDTKSTIVSLLRAGKVARVDQHDRTTHCSYELAPTVKERIVEILKDDGPLSMRQIRDKLGRKTYDEIGQLANAGTIISLRGGEGAVYGLPF